MARLYSLVLFCLVNTLSAKVVTAQTSNDIPVVISVNPARVTLYYESKCPYSRDFVVDQLLPAVLRGSELFHLDLVPYGNANTNETEEGIEFECQHGETECQGNKYHACAISITENKVQLLSFIACMMSDYDDIEAIAEECANELAIPWETLRQCGNGRAGDELLKAYGSITDDLEPPLTGVPTITINGDRGNETAVRDDLWGEIVKTSVVLVGQRRDAVPALTSVKPVNVALYYESKCPYSRDFVIEQLLPAVLRGPDFFNMDLIPYGKANVTETADGIEFVCQHGETECQGNKYHACAISITNNKVQQVSFVACMMSDYTDIESSAEECANQLAIPWETLKECGNGQAGGELLKGYGSITDDLYPKLTSVPTTTLNGDRGNVTAVTNDLWGEIVRLSQDVADPCTGIPSPVMASVYYEAKCPDSRNFVVEQLLPAVLRDPELFLPVLIPYGKASTNETSEGIEFTCQHGETECQGNKYHACAIAITGDKLQQVSFSACMMSNYTDIESIAEECANELAVPWATINSCGNGQAGNILLKAYGIITDDLDPTLTFVPTVTLNGERGNQSAILDNFWEQVDMAANSNDTVVCMGSTAKSSSLLLLFLVSSIVSSLTS